MRVIIAGGSGLLGRELTNALSARDYEVVILSRSPARVTGLPRKARAEKWDGKTTDGWGELVDGAAAIFNLAGAGIGDRRWTPARKRLIIDSRVEPGRAIAAAIEAAANKPGVVIQASAVGYYGGRGDEVLTEESGPGNDFPAEVCQQWEDVVSPVREMTRVVVIRTGYVLTTKGGALPRLLLPFKFFVGGPLGSGRQWFPWIHIEDEIQAMIALMENEKAQGAYNLAAPGIATNKELAQAIGRVLKRPAFFPAPAFAMKLVLGEVADAILEGQRASSQKLRDTGFQFLYPDLVPTLRDILENQR